MLYPSFRPLAAVTLCTCLLSSCASAPPANVQLTRDSAALVKRVHLRQSISESQSYSIRNPADTASAHAQAPATGDPLAALIGHIIAEKIIQGSTPQVEYQDPLLEFTRGVAFATPFQAKMKETAVRSDWLQLHEISEAHTVESTAEREAFLQGISGDSALFSDARYHFSSDYHRLYVITSTELWAKNGAMNPIHRAKYVFCSEAAGSPQDSIESYLNYWSANDSARFRNALQEGIQENMRMLQHGLFIRASALGAATTEPSPVEAHLAECGMNGTAAGWIVAQGSRRTLVRVASGDFYSAPMNGRISGDGEPTRARNSRATIMPVKQGM